VFAFIGRNGAGKTTTIRMILGLLEPTRGSATILGHDSASLSPDVRGRIGYLAEGHSVYGWMRVGEYGQFQRGFYPRWNQDIFAAVIDHFSIDPQTKAGHLSHGQRAGLHLAMTLAIEPEVLLLDDPATGLDPAARRSLLEAMVYFTRSRERTIFFSSHLLDDVERVADQVAILDYSVLRACSSIETFRDRVRRLVARFPAEPPRNLPDIPGLLQMAREHNELSLIGLLALSAGVKVAIGSWFDSGTRYRYTLDRQGRVLVVHTQRGAIKSVSDLEGRQPQALAGKSLETSTLAAVEAPLSGLLWPCFRSYRNPGRFWVRYGNESRPGSEQWFYVPDLGRLLGYDAPSRRLIGSIGPDGFVRPDQQPSERFQGKPSHSSFLYDAGPAAYLDLSGQVYTVNFRQRTVRTLFAPAERETVQGALRWEDEKRKLTRAFVLTDRSLHVV
jgi:ABC-2 type transport system ATP-binding protein